MTEPRSETVSSESEQLILVDGQDNAIGSLSKSECHDGDGVLHRAFSVFIFNSIGELLIQQRAADKRLWPSYWSNSCCSHPRVGESMDVATERRCQEELGISTALTFVYKFEYQVNYQTLGAENELCSVYVGTYTGPLDINRSEVSDYRWVSMGELSHDLNARPEQYTPWFAMEWQRLQNDFRDYLPRMD